MIAVTIPTSLALRRTSAFTTALVGLIPQPPLQAGVIELERRDEWMAATGSITTIGFNEFAPGTLITDQYSDEGILFTDGFYTIKPFDPITFPQDGWGLDGNGDITVVFDEPQMWIAADFPGHLAFELYRNGRLIYTSTFFGFGGGVGNFGGLISSEPFDMAVLMDLTKGFQAEIDDLHFGVPAPSALWWLALGGLWTRRRRAGP